LLDVGVINYAAQFVGAPVIGDLAIAADDEFVIPPCFVIWSHVRMAHSR